MPASRFFTVIDSVDSTNNYAMAQVHGGTASHGMAWYARNQTAGKGQRGKSWEAEPGKNIALSLVLQPQSLNVPGQFYLSASVALACHEFFCRYAGDETKIKWPNDLYWRDRKAGGILIETIYHGAILKYAIAGIGININQTKFATDLKNPVSLKQITGKEYDALVLAKELYALLMKRTGALDPTSFKKTMKEYNQHLYGLNKKVKLKKDNAIFETVIKEVNDKGQLITADAVERYFNFGEVKWIPDGG
jgi:BirA family transcriptional regulator, biotin operon repressor / biotin---[acetyl-CoA-carboxylase] ligase